MPQPTLDLVEEWIVHHPTWRNSDAEHGRQRALVVPLRSDLQVLGSILGHAPSLAEGESMTALRDYVIFRQAAADVPT